MPTLHSGEGIQAVHAVRAGAHVDLIVGDARARFGVAGRREVPELPSRGGVKAVKLGASIFMQTFANVEAPTGETWGRKDLLHRPIVVKPPDFFAGFLIQTVNHAVIRKTGALNG